MTCPHATTGRLPIAHLPGGDNGRAPCDCRRHTQGIIDGLLVCLRCGHRVRLRPAPPSLRQRIASWCRLHQADILTGAVPVVVVIGAWLGGLWP
jgi:hypothetical protein